MDVHVNGPFQENEPQWNLIPLKKSGPKIAPGSSVRVSHRIANGARSAFSKPGTRETGSLCSGAIDNGTGQFRFYDDVAIDQSLALHFEIAIALF